MGIENIENVCNRIREEYSLNKKHDMLAEGFVGYIDLREYSPLHTVTIFCYNLSSIHFLFSVEISMRSFHTWGTEGASFKYASLKYEVGDNALMAYLPFIIACLLMLICLNNWFLEIESLNKLPLGLPTSTYLEM